MLRHAVSENSVAVAYPARLGITLSVEELAFLANVWPHTEELERVLLRIQDLDPPGVAARDLPECLCIQLRQLGLPEDSLPAQFASRRPDVRVLNFAVNGFGMPSNRSFPLWRIGEVLPCIKR